jgi:hypothetical protein
MQDHNDEIREQAYSVLRNISVDEAGMNVIIAGLGESALFDQLTETLSSTSEDVVLQVSTLLSDRADESSLISAYHRLLLYLQI